MAEENIKMEWQAAASDSAASCPIKSELPQVSREASMLEHEDFEEPLPPCMTFMERYLLSRLKPGQIFPESEEGYRKLVLEAAAAARSHNIKVEPADGSIVCADVELQDLPGSALSPTEAEDKGPLRKDCEVSTINSTEPRHGDQWNENGLPLPRAVSNAHLRSSYLEAESWGQPSNLWRAQGYGLGSEFTGTTLTTTKAWALQSMENARMSTTIWKMDD